MPRATWKVLVDWNNDGDFDDTYDDISGDIRSLQLTHNRRLDTDHMEPARLTLRLNNINHLYSPPNSGGALSGNLLPGRKVHVRAAYPFDTFTDGAGLGLAAHTPDSSDYSWTAQLGSFAIAVGGVHVSISGSGSDQVATMDMAHADITIGCDITRASDTIDHPGLTFRLSNTSNYLYARITGTAIEIRKVDGGADSLIDSTAHTWATQTRKFMQIALHGTSIRVFVDGAEINDTTSTFNQTATKHGLFADGAADHLYDNFGAWASLFTGFLDTIQPIPDANNQVVELVATDDSARLQDITLYMYSQTATPQSSDEIIDDILDYADVATADRQLDSGVDLVPTLWTPAAWHVQALAEIRRLGEEEDGLIYVDGHGLWRLEERDHRTTSPHTTSKATIKDTDDGSNPYFERLEWQDSNPFIENKLLMRIREANNDGAQTYWTLTEVPAFSAAETKLFLAESKAYDIALGTRTPVASTDYTANTQADGAGTDITSELTVTVDATKFIGKGSLISVTFGATPGYLTLLQARTLNAFTYNDPVSVIAEDATSQSAYGTRIRAIGGWAAGTPDDPKGARWTREVAVAQACIDNRLARRKDPKTVLHLDINAGAPANLILMLHRGISDRVTASYSTMGINEAFFIEGKTFEVRQGDTEVICKLLMRGV